MRFLRALLPLVGLLLLAGGLFLGLVPEVDDVALDDGSGTVTCDPPWRDVPDTTDYSEGECDEARSARSVVAFSVTAVGGVALLVSVVVAVVAEVRRSRWAGRERDAMLQRLEDAVARAEAAAARVGAPAPAPSPIVTAVPPPRQG